MDTTTTLVDYYAILEIPRTAAEPQIKEAVKKQRRQWYKRQNAPTTEKRREAEDRIRDISAAETTLLDPNRRAAYDRQLASYVPPAPETDGASEGQDWTARAVDLLRQNLPEAAHGAAREATDRKGSDHEAWAVRGRASLLMNRADSAVFEFSEAIHLQPNADEYHSDLGDAYSARGDLPRAFESYGTAARLAPDNRGYPVSIASVHLMAGRPDMAVAVLDPLHAADPRDEVCSVYLAMALSDWVWSTWTRTGAETSTITSREQIDFSTEKLARAMSLTFDDREVRAELDRQMAFVQDAQKIAFRLPGVGAMSEMDVGAGCMTFLGAYIVIPLILIAIASAQPVLGVALIGLSAYAWYKSAFKPQWKRNAANAK